MSKQASVSKAIKTLKAEGFSVAEANTNLVRMSKNCNWIEIERDGSSYLAYKLDGLEYAYGVNHTQLNCATQVAIDLF